MRRSHLKGFADGYWYEELSHLEVIGTLARMHLKPTKKDRDAAEADPLIAICGGGGVDLRNSMGNAWTADYLKITGQPEVDLRSNIAAETGAKIVYERLIDFCDDVGSKDALQFLMTREITHMKAFMTALESLGKPPLTVGEIAPTPKLVDQFFNASTGKGDQGDDDTIAPWNEGGSWERVDAPAFQDFASEKAGTRPANLLRSSQPNAAEAVALKRKTRFSKSQKGATSCLARTSSIKLSPQHCQAGLYRTATIEFWGFFELGHSLNPQGPPRRAHRPPARHLLLNGPSCLSELRCSASRWFQ